MKKQRFRAVFFHIGIWLLMIAFLFSGLVLSATIPNHKIKENMEKSALSYAAKDAFEFTQDGYWNAIADHYADTILLNIAWHMGEEFPIIASLDTKYYDGEDLGENAGLYLAVTEGISPNVRYTRYWHGMAAFVRWIHLFSDVHTVKMIGFLVSMALLLGVLILLISKKHWDIAILFTLSLVAVQIWNIRISMEYQPTFLIAFLFCILFLCFEKTASKRLTVLCVLCGTMTCFFDFLTTETITFLLPMILTCAVRIKEKRMDSVKKELHTVITCGSCWFLAYIGTFFMKWTLTSIVTKSNVWTDAFSSAADRIGGAIENANEMIPNSIFSSITANFSTIFYCGERVEYGKTLCLSALILVGLLSVWYVFRRKDGEMGTIIILMLGSIVPIRYFILNNHSFLHNFFTYRALSAFVFALLVALWFNIQMPIRKRGR